MNWAYPSAAFPRSERAEVARRYTGGPHFSPSSECECCHEFRPSTRHHLIPKEIAKCDETVRLCWPCHRAIHLLPNRQIATMPREAQLDYILTSRALAGARRDPAHCAP